MSREMVLALFLWSCQSPPGAPTAADSSSAAPGASSSVVTKPRRTELSVTELHHAHAARPNLWRGKEVSVRGRYHSSARVGGGVTIAVVAAVGEPKPSISCALETGSADLQAGDAVVIRGRVESAQGVMLGHCSYQKDNAAEPGP